MTTISELPTPSLLIEQSRLEKNINRMQSLALANRVNLTPHTKTHKSVHIARMQTDSGARGITVAKVGEAEIYARNGFDDIYIAYTIVGDDKYQRILNLMHSGNVRFNVDGYDGAQMASAFFAARDTVADVMVEVDAGYHRCGMPWDSNDIIDLIKRVDASNGLRFKGIMTHAGHSYNGPQESESRVAALKRVADEERDRMISLADRLAGVGLIPETVSIGSTPTMSAFENRVSDEGQTITEIRPGNYVFNDAIQVGLGVASLQDCSMTVLATVVSVQADSNGRERLFLDAGKKVFTSDTGYRTKGYGTLLYNSRTMTELPHANLYSLSEEHGWVGVAGGATFSVGDRVRVVPNHACVVMNTQPHAFIVDGQEVVDKINIDAQSMVV